MKSDLSAQQSAVLSATLMPERASDEGATEHDNTIEGRAAAESYGDTTAPRRGGSGGDSGGLGAAPFHSHIGAKGSRAGSGSPVNLVHRTFDLEDPASAAEFGLDASGNRLPGQAGRPTALIGSTTRGLVVLRESVQDLTLLDGMIQQTCRHHAEKLPGALEVAALGTIPATSPEFLDNALPGCQWARLRFRSIEVVLLRHRGTDYMYAMGSAAKEVAGVNDFTAMLIRLIRALRPTEVYVSTFTRLTRTINHATGIKEVLQKAGATVHTVEMDIKPGTATGTIVWEIMAMLAAGERELILTRLFCGKVNALLKGLWPFGDPRTIPLGFVKDADGRLHLDLSLVPIIIQVYEILATPYLSDEDCAHAIRELGVPEIRARAAGDKAENSKRYANRGNARMMVERFLRQIDLYLTGQYVYRLVNPYKDMNEVFGYPVVRGADRTRDRHAFENDADFDEYFFMCDDDQDEYGHVYIPFPLERPEIPEELLLRAREVRTRPQSSSPHLKRGLPFGSWGWTHGGLFQWLRPAGTDSYTVLERNLEDGEAPGARYAAGTKTNGTQIAAFSSSLLHASILDSVSAGLMEGVPIIRLDGRGSLAGLVGPSRADETRELIARKVIALKQVRQELSNNTRAFSRTSDPDTWDRLEQQGTRLNHKVMKLEAEVATLEAELKAPRTRFTDFDTPAEILLQALAHLQGSKMLDHSTRRSLSYVITDFRLTVRESAIDWELSLVIPTMDDSAKVGPFRGSIARSGRVVPAAVLRDPTNSGRPAEARAAVEQDLRSRWLLTGWGAEPGGPHGQGFADKEMAVPPQYTRAHSAAKCVSCAPGLYLPRVLLGEEVSWPDCEDDFDHGAFNTHVRKEWSDPAWGGNQYYRTHPKRQLFTDIVAAYGGEATVKTLLELVDAQQDVTLTYNDIVRLTLPAPAASVTRDWLPSVERDGIWSSTESRAEHTMRSRRCPLCNEPATAVVRVLEVPGDLLCRSCRVSPDLPGLVFPPMYVALALSPTPSRILGLADGTTSL